MTDHTPLIAAHEAGHCVAAYTLNWKIGSVEVGSKGGQMRHHVVADGWGVGLPLFDRATIALAGEAFTDSLGLARVGTNHHDQETAALAIVQAALPRGESPRSGSRQAAEYALQHVEAYTRKLVATERFCSLALALTAELKERGSMDGPEVSRFLQARDPLRRAQERAQAPSSPRGSLETLSIPGAVARTEVV